MGLADDAPLVALVATLPSKLVGAEQRARLRAALTVAGRGMVVARHHEVVALLPVGASGPAQVVEGVRTAVVSLLGDGILTSVGLSCARTGFHEIPWAYEDARTAMGSLLGRPGVRAMDEMSTLDLLISSQKNARLVPPEVRAFVEEDLATGRDPRRDAQHLRLPRPQRQADRDAAPRARQHDLLPPRPDRRAHRCDVRRVEDLIDLLLAVRLVRAETP